ncbi:MAG TPA: YbhB/YbcL family Raf kinase inhibitor-like protein [Candidatus Acidoferrum sp.]|nr:YbhB/YbcL family Raf kinase inhibitor-like protein [Candidatus Acidoferrum sp.]
MRLICEAFRGGNAIPREFTCDGGNISPAFRWEDAPEATKSFALILHDPDAPRHDGFFHWLVYNIPPSVTVIRENVPKMEEQIDGLGTQGKNDSGTIGYTGPCPPSGSHRYFARLHALREELHLAPGATGRQVRAAMEGLEIEQAETMGTYSPARAQTA